jgi:hypothetical protein
MNSFPHVLDFGILEFLNFHRARTDTLTLSYSTDVSGLFSDVPVLSVICMIVFSSDIAMVTEVNNNAAPAQFYASIKQPFRSF